MAHIPEVGSFIGGTELNLLWLTSFAEMSGLATGRIVHVHHIKTCTMEKEGAMEEKERRGAKPPNRKVIKIKKRGIVKNKNAFHCC